MNIKSKFILLNIMIVNGFALSISPINLEIDHAKAQGYYTLINDDVSQKVIAITTKSREIDSNGISVYEPTKDLIVYPKQVVLKPKEKRLIRVIFKGNNNFTAEKAYRITFAEKNISVDFDEMNLGEGKRAAGVSFGVRFDGTVFVQPKKAAVAKIEVTSYDRQKVEGEEFFIVTLKNTGTKHRFINTKDLELELLMPTSEKKEAWHLLSEDLLVKHVGGSMLLLAGGQREIKIPVHGNQIPSTVLGVRITE